MEAKPKSPAPVLSEAGVIARLKARFASDDRRLRLGIGDDAAVLRLHEQPDSARRLGAADLVVTCDLAVEGVHFSLRYMSLADAGYKTLAMNLSDLAAMGATPAFAFGSLGLPGGTTGQQLDELLDGVEEAARAGGIALAGGDTVAAPQWIISFTLLGEVQGAALTRSGARPGDLIWHSGELGLSQIGLHELWGASDAAALTAIEAACPDCCAAHRRPQPQLALGQWLQHTKLATAVLDLSDSLSQCLLLLAEASAVGLALDFTRYPFAATLGQFAARHRRRGAAAVQVPARLDPQGRARSYASCAGFLLASAEDFGLLFTAPPSATARLLREAPARLCRLGTVVEAAEGCHYRDELGGSQQLQASGFEHLEPR